MRTLNKVNALSCKYSINFLVNISVYFLKGVVLSKRDHQHRAILTECSLEAATTVGSD